MLYAFFLCFFLGCHCPDAREIDSSRTHLQSHRPVFAILTDSKLDILESLEKHLRMIARDFKEEGSLYKTWQKDGNSTSLYFSFNNSNYSLHETIGLLRETVQEVEDVLLTSNGFEFFVNPDARPADNSWYYRLKSALSSYIEICIATDDESELISALELNYFICNRVCVYDLASYFIYVAGKTDLVQHIEKALIKPQQFSRKNVQTIINLLKKISHDTDVALSIFFASERTIAANVASLQKSGQQYEEALKTLRYLDAFVATQNFEYQKTLDAIGMPTDPKPHKASQPQTEMSDNTNAFIKIRTTYVPSILRSQQSRKLKIATLISSLCASPRSLDDVENHESSPQNGKD